MIFDENQTTNDDDNYSESNTVSFEFYPYEFYPSPTYYRQPFRELINGGLEFYHDNEEDEILLNQMIQSGFMPRYSIEKIFVPLPISTFTYQDAGKFPTNISSYLWGRQGKNDEEDWILLGQLTNDLFFYYTAWCDYTGFDCRGGMKMYLAHELYDLVRMAMSKEERKYFYEPMLREQARTALYRQELIEKTWHPSRMYFYPVNKINIILTKST